MRQRAAKCDDQAVLVRRPRWYRGSAVVSGWSNTTLCGLWKLVRGGVREYLFQLKTDPGEKHNLLANHPDIASRLRMHLQAWGANLTPPGVDRNQLRRAAANFFDYFLVGKPAASPPLSRSPADAATRREQRKQPRQQDDQN